MELIFLNLFLISTHHYVLKLIHGIVWGYGLFSFSCVHIVLLATVPKFIYPLCWWTFALFPVFVHCLYTHSLIYASTINTFVCFQCTCAGFSRSGTAALYACLFCFPRQCQTVFQNGYINIHSHYNWRKFLWLHILIILGIWLLTFLPIWRLRKKIILEY